VNQRRRRLRRVLEIRERVLDDCAHALIKSNVDRDQAEQHAQSEKARLELASRHRAMLTSGSVEVRAWVEAEQWLRARGITLDDALGRLETAEQRVNAARREVLQAHTGVKQIETIDERMASRDAQEQGRTEQRINDELVLRRYGPGRRGVTD